MRARLMLLLGSLFLGCSKPEPSEEIAFQIMVPPTANAGSPFYFVAEQSVVADFYMSDYQKVADMTFGEGKHDITKVVLIPGRTQTIRAPLKEPGKPIAAYFLFTSPSEEWKIIFDNPEYRHYKIRVSKNGIEEAHGY